MSKNCSIEQLNIEEHEREQRIDQVLANRHPEQSRAMVQTWIDEGRVKIDGKRISKAGYRLRNARQIEVEIPPPPPKYNLLAEKFEFPILFEDEHLLIINKPPNLVIHPAPGHHTGTLVNALLSHIPEFQENVEEPSEPQHLRPGIVHRLDKDTSGCLLIAKNPMIQQKLSSLFAIHNVRKQYITITQRIPNPTHGIIENLMARNPHNRLKMAIVPKDGKTAITHYKVVSEGAYERTPCALVLVDIKTGRTHQIRVHMASLQTPVVGDNTYGGKHLIPADRQMLHAWHLDFTHPETHEKLHLTAPLPDDFCATMLMCQLKLPPSL